MKTSFRRASSEDLSSVLDLVRECVRAMRAAGLDQWDEIYPDRETFARDIESKTLHLAETGEGLIGCVVLNEFQDQEYEDVPWRYSRAPIAVVHRLMIHPSAQGRGVARELMAFIESQAKSNGYRTLRLDAFTQNPRAQSLYQSLGYNLSGTVTFRKGQFHCFEKPL